MCELQWEPLAEIHYDIHGHQTNIFCLCSRVFIRGKIVSEHKNIYDDFEEDSASERTHSPQQENLQTIVHFQLPSVVNTNKHHDIDTEISSCYYSASHTDNISTDEHDSLRESHVNIPNHPKCLHSSDSGADLSEYGHQDGVEDEDFQKYWRQHGDSIVWSSWIDKYRSFINPVYIKTFSKESDLLLDSNGKSVEDEEPKAKEDEQVQQEVVMKNQMLKRNLSGSDSYEKLTNVHLEGWNQLSPVSIECETEVEKLLSSRCGSVSSSTANTVGTTDSMTNVTRMTVSSIDLSESSKCSSISSPISSVSIQSSDQSNSEDVEDMDSDQYWQELWRQHYEQQYFETHYKFLCDAKTNLSDNDNLVMSVNNCTTTSTDVIVEEMLEKLEMVDSENETVETEKNQSNQTINDDHSDASTLQLPALGLPSSFGRQSNRKSGDGDDEPPEERVVMLKRSHEIDDDDGDESSDQIKKAYSLMGYSNSGPLDKGALKARVIYRKRHIRLQNRHLNMHRKTIREPKHVYFDDDGNVLTNPIDKVKLFLKSQIEEQPMSISSDEDFTDLFTSTKINNSKENCDEIKMQSNDSVELLLLSNDNNDDDDAQFECIDDITVFENANDTECFGIPNSVKRKEKKRKKKNNKFGNVPSEIKENPNLMKYWFKRFSLFHKFDQGIKLDQESWFSVTPEKVAKHTAERCRCDVVIDAFCGAGGNAIQFAFSCERVIAIDIDPNKISLAQHNAGIYGVADRIEFIVGDYFQLAGKLQGDVVFLSPPWGGPSYLENDVYDLETMLQPMSISELMTVTRRITENVALFLPRNSDVNQLVLLAGSGNAVEIEQNFLDKKLIALTAYYGEIIKE